MNRLENLSDERVLNIVKHVVADLPNDTLRAAIEQLEKDGRLISDLTRQHLAEALNAWPLAGKGDLLEMLRKYWPIDHLRSSEALFGGRDDGPLAAAVPLESVILTESPPTYA